MDKAVIYDLATHPEIIERIAGLLGPDLIVWATNFWLKEPGGAEIPWHQDINFWPLEPPVNASAWIAIDEVTVENSCVRIVPGSHRESLPHTKAEAGMAFGKMAHPDSFDASRPVNMELQPGRILPLQRAAAAWLESQCVEQASSGHVRARYAADGACLPGQGTAACGSYSDCGARAGCDGIQSLRGASLSPLSPPTPKPPPPQGLTTSGFFSVWSHWH